MSISFDSRNYDKYVDVKIEVDGVKHDLGFHGEVSARSLLNELEEAVADLKDSIECNRHFSLIIDLIECPEPT